MICIYHYKTEQYPSSSAEEFANKAFVLIKDVTGSDAIKFLTIEKNKRSQEEAIDLIKKADANDYVIIDNIGSLGTNLYDNYQTITTLLINKVIVLFADAPISLKRQIDPNFNKQFLAGIQYHLYSLKEQENNNKKKCRKTCGSISSWMGTTLCKVEKQGNIFKNFYGTNGLKKSNILQFIN